MFWFIMLLLVAGAGFYFYQKLTTIEREIRTEQAAEKARAVASSAEVVEPEQPEEVPELVAVEREPTIAETPVPVVFASFEDEILAAINNLPGIRQTELSASFPDVEKKKFQQTLKKLADDGSVRREKEGSSYQLFPV
ncbi:MAG TPA: hypothetical protein VIR78_12295 [Malonomonas sp.]